MNTRLIRLAWCIAAYSFGAVGQVIVIAPSNIVVRVIYVGATNVPPTVIDKCQIPIRMISSGGFGGPLVTNENAVFKRR